jgi:hypothetical protein
MPKNPQSLCLSQDRAKPAINRNGKGSECFRHVSCGYSLGYVVVLGHILADLYKVFIYTDLYLRTKNSLKTYDPLKQQKE